MNASTLPSLVPGLAAASTALADAPRWITVVFALASCISTLITARTRAMWDRHEGHLPHRPPSRPPAHSGTGSRGTRPTTRCPVSDDLVRDRSRCLRRPDRLRRRVAGDPSRSGPCRADA